MFLCIGKKQQRQNRDLLDERILAYVTSKGFNHSVDAEGLTHSFVYTTIMVSVEIRRNCVLIYSFTAENLEGEFLKRAMELKSGATMGIHTFRQAFQQKILGKLVLEDQGKFDRVMNEFLGALDEVYGLKHHNVG
mmetsp:Transcript_11944/g.19801  ORF Transcript_11944/g.19801 Transcript_11944/m.19801 type:complete len:135 (-) Transcript_11944:157-561(-)|eukprot:CAMPEP_0119004858 /NCGR_PEP_ID=MMETSP1176-20130426/1397_1 /TAXON_ID=265551 /ORGANISM="Synedropsis recta cf, Strain CCMP1620" /LENGTH=134 /DNA_ID=CAMNT_0006956613 /DNA_START=110 /DNA_END=514 /DNA_ORIENTATION=+